MKCSRLSQILHCFRVFLMTDCSFSRSVLQGKVIYHLTMTPTWLVAHASYIDSSRTVTAQQLKFSGGEVENAALLRVPMIRYGVFNDSTPLTVEITLAHDVSIGNVADSDISYGVSELDGVGFIGFVTVDKSNYGSCAPCYSIEGVSGVTLSAIRNGPYLPKPNDSFYPGQWVFTLKLDESWGSCYTAHDGGFVRTAGYDNRLAISKGLTLEVYKENKGEQVGIRFIKVAIIQDEA